MNKSKLVTIASIQKTLDKYYEKGKESNLNVLYEKICRMSITVINRYYSNLLESTEERDIVVHTAVTDLILRVQIDRDIESINLSFLKSFLHGYFPDRAWGPNQYENTRDTRFIKKIKADIRVKNNKFYYVDDNKEWIGPFDDKITAKKKTQRLIALHKVDIVDYREELMLPESAKKEIEHTKHLDSVLMDLYDRAYSLCPILGLKGQIANLIITLRLSGMDRIPGTHVHSVLIKALTEQLYKEVKGGLCEPI